MIEEEEGTARSREVEVRHTLVLSNYIAIIV